MSLETMTKLASTTVGAGGSSTVVFSNIPQNYTDLSIKISCRTSRAADEDGLGVQFNNTTTGYTYRVLAGDGASATSVSTPYGQLWTARIQGASPGTSVFSSTDLTIPNYSGNTPKTIAADSVTEKNGTNGYITSSGVFQTDSSPITSITLSGLNAPFQQFSTFTLYGIKNAAQTAGNSIKATGGNIVFDGTYVYHVFNTTGAFVPTQALTADVLAVAGGGGGGCNVGGGGGAGGLIFKTLNSLAPISYPVTVGAGGTGGTANSVRGTNGSDTNFSNLTAAVGGGVGGNLQNGYADGGNGGNGGGSGTAFDTGSKKNGGSSTQTGTGLTAYYGNAGGSTGPGTNGYYSGGSGGGGAGAAGSNGTIVSTAGAGGNGGIGISTYSDWGVATGQGQNVSGVYYLAGGGGGGAQGTNTQGTGGSGGGGTGGNNSAPTNGTVGTGGGGGGGGNSSTTGAAGGSGIVIIRYKG